MDSATDLVRAKLRTLSPTLDRDTATRRLVGMLARRGFNSGTAYRVVSAELEAAFRTNEPGDPTEPAAQSATGDETHAADASDILNDSPTTSEDDEQSRATDLVRAKLRTLPPNLDRAKAMNRLVGLLARRGISQSTAYAVVKAELAGTGYS
ncbi:hypothetical protein [Nocardia sp. NPDC004722]